MVAVEGAFLIALGRFALFLRSNYRFGSPLASNPSTTRVLRTPWGDLSPRVDLFPLVYILVLYGVVYFLPFGVFDFWRKGEDGLAEWIQFAGYFGAACFASLVLVKTWSSRRSVQWVCWLLMALFCFYVAGEEISWAERITGYGVIALRESNAQSETNLHNHEIVQGFLHFSFIASGLFFGWFGWRFWPAIRAFPARDLSLYFLFVALFYAYWDLSWMTLGERIRNDQEAIEILMSTGLFLHCFRSARGVASK